MTQPLPAGLLEEIHLGSARGKRGAEVTFEIVRELTTEDLQAIQAPPPVAAPAQTVTRLRSSHHQLAQLLARGELTQAQISYTTGYSQSYISNLKNDPMFRELLEFYQDQKEKLFSDVMEKIRVLGLDATEALHEKLNNPEEVWSKRELMELVELTAVGPATAQPKGGVAPGPAIALEVKFVGARPRDPQPIIDVTARGPSRE